MMRAVSSDSCIFQISEPIAKLSVAVELYAGEEQEWLFLAPVSVCYALLHHINMGLGGFSAIGSLRRMASTPSLSGVTAN